MQQLVRMFPDVRVHTPYPIQFGGDDWITVVTSATGTFTGEMALPDGKMIPPTGKAFDLEFAQTSKWEGDRLIIISAFWDSAFRGSRSALRRRERYRPVRAGVHRVDQAWQRHREKLPRHPRETILAW